MDGRGNVSFHPLRFPGEMSTLRNRCFWCVEPMLWRQGGNSGVCQSRIVRRRERGRRFLVRGVNLTSSKLSSGRRGSAIAVSVRGQGTHYDAGFVCPMPRSSTHDVNYTSLRYLWQQPPKKISHARFIPQRHAHHLRTNRTRLPELDEKMIEVHPLPVDLFSDNFPNTRTGSHDPPVMQMDRDSLKTLNLLCDCSKRHGNPFDAE